jgi:carboxypeptidase C (cathepsin A)
MTKDEILKIKEHIEIHARKEPHAVEITKTLRKAVAELEYLAELEKAYFELREQCTNPGGIKLAQETALSTEYAIEELKKEAEEKAKKRTKGFACQENCETSYVMGALDFAEPREKRIKELEKEVDEVKLKSGYSTYLEDKIKIDELELKIKNLTKHLEPQAMTEIFKQVEEEVKQEQRIKNMKNCLKKWLKYENERDYELNVDELLTETMQLLEEKE